MEVKFKIKNNSALIYLPINSFLYEIAKTLGYDYVNDLLSKKYLTSAFTDDKGFTIVCIDGISKNNVKKKTLEFINEIKLFKQEEQICEGCSLTIKECSCNV